MPTEMIRIHNATTGETIDREMTDEEYAAFLLIKEENEQRRLQEEAKLIKKAEAEAKLAALGLTTEDLKALGL